MAKFTIEFGPKSAERLDGLARLLEASRAEVVRRALEHYEDHIFQRERQRNQIRQTEQVSETVSV